MPSSSCAACMRSIGSTPIFGWPLAARLRRRDPRRGGARRAGAPADHRAGAGLAADQPASRRPAACCSSCRASRRCCSAPISAISAFACRCIELGDIYVSFARLLAFGVALIGAGRALSVSEAHLSRHRDPRHRPGPRDHGADGRRASAASIFTTSAIGGGARRACRRACSSLQYDVHPFIGNSFGPIIFMICVLGGLGNMIGGFRRRLYHQPDHLDRRLLLLDRVLLCARLPAVSSCMMFVRPQGIFGR